MLREMLVSLPLWSRRFDLSVCGALIAAMFSSKVILFPPRGSCGASVQKVRGPDDACGWTKKSHSGWLVVRSS